MTKKGLKVWKWHPKPSPSDSCFSCGHFEWSHDYSATILNLRPKLAKMAKNDRKRPKMTKNGLNVCNMTEIDWFDVVTALKGQFWVSVLTSSSSEAGPAKNLNFGTVKNFSWNAATDHISSFSFTQSAKFLRTRAKSEDMFFQKMSFCPDPFLAILGQFLHLFWPFWPNCRKTYLTWLFHCKKVERNWKNWAETKNDKFDPQNALKRTQSQKWPLKRLRVAKFGWNASQGT